MSSKSCPRRDSSASRLFEIRVLPPSRPAHAQIRIANALCKFGPSRVSVADDMSGLGSARSVR